ncbi:MAG: bifunctional adenosylcobinamide kinase/adenosylcobinamide-phosphate guanylyltransferase [Rhodospirillaceae bacterium]|nr:bifunctional adenosylcobinamide kinase/adenosylcobinamide-phosphate guanylyltransferase [Rhodospirillaceae bacterium]MBC27745.1 bifunctional adenosylcobinamide kinase/adenosylcobinamide-phosphate guanylyltransferase [Rhodospirillaceae bacterium]|tara:strand:- start:1743 stop:2279 length:537 start_codon:yes stop_codon:yes gene_type:complete
MATNRELPAVTLVLGGARSGKSLYAERCIKNISRQPVYIATAEPGDPEMIERIKRHRERRGSNWETVEESIDLVGVLKVHRKSTILIDCLTLWLTNLILADHDVEESVSELALELGQAEGSVFLVSNEVGSGIMPENALARKFCDVAGQMNQIIASKASSVILVTAGIPQSLKAPQEV